MQNIDSYRYEPNISRKINLSNINFEVQNQNKSLMSAVNFVRTLVLLRYLKYIQKDILKEFRRYECTLDHKELPLRSVSSHFQHRHREVYDFVKNIVNKNIELKRDTVLCLCGGHYKVDGKKQHELTGIHRKWQLTTNTYTQLPTRKQTLSTLT